MFPNLQLFCNRQLLYNCETIQWSLAAEAVHLLELYLKTILNSQGISHGDGWNRCSTHANMCQTMKPMINQSRTRPHIKGCQKHTEYHPGENFLKREVSNNSCSLSQNLELCFHICTLKSSSIADSWQSGTDVNKD